MDWNLSESITKPMVPDLFPEAAGIDRLKRNHCVATFLYGWDGPVYPITGTYIYNQEVALVINVVPYGGGLHVANANP